MALETDQAIILDPTIIMDGMFANTLVKHSIVQEAAGILRGIKTMRVAYMLIPSITIIITAPMAPFITATIIRTIYTEMGTMVVIIITMSIMGSTLVHMATVATIMDTTTITTAMVDTTIHMVTATATVTATAGVMA